jgi:hypothetical protein
MPILTIIEGLWGAVTIGFTVLLSPLLRAWYSHWGMSPADSRQPLPGDEYVPRPKSEISGAIDIQAPPESIWPWFVQLGCQRGGWYSYDLLDNGGQPSATRIIPEYQHLAVGDIIKAVPNGAFGFPVAAFEPNRYLVMAGTMDTRTGQPADPVHPPLEFFSGDQAFYLAPLNSGATRLVFRMRTDWNSKPLLNFIYKGFLEPISFIMARKTLFNIKKRVEKNKP